MEKRANFKNEHKLMKKDKRCYTNTLTEDFDVSLSHCSSLAANKELCATGYFTYMDDDGFKKCNCCDHPSELQDREKSNVYRIVPPGGKKLDMQNLDEFLL